MPTYAQTSVTITTTNFGDSDDGIASNVITRSNAQAPSAGVCPASGYSGATTVSSPDDGVGEQGLLQVHADWHRSCRQHRERDQRPGARRQHPAHGRVLVDQRLGGVREQFDRHDLLQGKRGWKLQAARRADRRCHWVGRGLGHPSAALSGAAASPTRAGARLPGRAVTRTPSVGAARPARRPSPGTRQTTRTVSSTSTTFTLVLDNTPPTGGSLTPAGVTSSGGIDYSTTGTYRDRARRLRRDAEPQPVRARDEHRSPDRQARGTPPPAPAAASAGL